MADAPSIEETNRLRMSLGLKPLPVPGASGPVFKETATLPTEDTASTLESRQAESYDNYRKLQEADEARKSRHGKADAVKKARDAAKRFSKLEGKGLGDADEGDDIDAKTWLIKQKRRQKQIEKARKTEQELAAAEAATAAEYTAKELAGVKVGHEWDAFQEGGDQVLTLKDATIDENEEEGDELENLDLREVEKLSEKLNLKKKKPVYNPHEIEESGENNILSHYDEEIDGKKRSRFTLDGQGSAAEARESLQSSVGKPKLNAISLDILKDEPRSDYLDISEIKVKKPKKKKAKSTRQKAADEDDIFPDPDPLETQASVDTMEIDLPADAPKKRAFEDMSFVDDEDLQASLAARRRGALKKRQMIRPEAIAQQMREEALVTPGDVDVETNGEHGLIIDETSEFVANIQKPTARESKRRSVSQKPKIESDEEGDIDMDGSYAAVEDEDDRAARHAREDSATAQVTNNGLDEELTLSRGLGSTLRLLKDRGILKTADSGDLNTIFREKQKFLAEKQRREAEAERKARAQRERDRNTGRLDRMSAREREDYARQQNTYRDQMESRQLAEHFNKEYMPNVELKYVDEYGRHMNEKEAFKDISHQFHGKGSGKQKTEKKLKKIADEKKREAKSALDNSQTGGMSGVTSQQLKKQRQAGVRLA